MDPVKLAGAVQEAIQAFLASSPAGPLLNSVARLWTNAGVIPSNQSLLADFTQATFQGYAPRTGQSPTTVWLDDNNVWHATFPGVSWVATRGVAEVMHNTFAGTITMAGTVTGIVTAAGMTGSPRTVTVNVTVGEDMADIAEDMAEAINADADTGPFFSATAAGAVLTLTARTAAANDATFNVALDNGTATGLTPAPTATISVPGQAYTPTDEVAQGVYFTDASGGVYRGAAPFASGVPMSTPGNAVFSTPDVPYGA